MKNIFLTTLLLLLFLGAGQTLRGQEFPAVDKSVLDVAYYPPRAAFRSFAKTEEEKKAAEPVIRVLYSRPLKNDRDIFGSLIKYGEVWRAGANESTEILFYKDVTINGATVKAGRYTVYVTPHEGKWDVVFSSDLDGWGAYAYNAEHNVASVTAPTSAAGKVIEAFSIMFEKADDGAHMVMGWDKTVARVPIQF